jgi:adenosylhomocysteine nucleosidase
MDPTHTLVCFAVKEEAKFFYTANCQRLITGMGQTNAEKSLRKQIASARPGLVLTCGFAGGLNPDLKFGTVVFDEDVEAGLRKRLEALGAVPARFHCSRRVADTAAEKAELWKTTGADAVEMESSVIRAICREQKIPAATVRVISDAAQEDLPLDFNALMTADDRINYPKLIWRVLSEPKNIRRLKIFQEQTMLAARKLGQMLDGLLVSGRN